MRWNGSTWVELGSRAASERGISRTSGASVNPSLAINQFGTLVVAWQDDSSGNEEIYVRRWTGKFWEEIGSGSASNGGISKNSGFSRSPSDTRCYSGKTIVAWEDNSGTGGDNFEIYARVWNGSGWDELAGSAHGGGISGSSRASYAATAAIGADGEPLVAWSDMSGTQDFRADIYFRRWGGSSWQEMDAGSASGGGISNLTGFSVDPQIGG